MNTQQFDRPAALAVAVSLALSGMLLGSTESRALEGAEMGPEPQPSAASGSVAAAQSAQQDSAAQQDDAEDQQEIRVEEVDRMVVTGSRIERAGFDTLQSATVIDEEFMDIRGFDNAAQALNELPQFGIPGSSNQGGQAANNVGQNIVNLFGLGSQRTLTLINGRRTVGQNTPNIGGAAPGLQVDMNIIPTGLIDRIETIEIGGAPIYGSDAVAGTVNVILKDDYQGFETDLQFGTTEDGHGDSWRYRTLLGGNFADDRGNVVISFEWNKQDSIDASDRPDLVNSPAFVPNPLDTGPSDGIVDNIFMRDALNVWQVPNTGFMLLGNDAVSGLQDENGNPTFNGFLSGGQILPRNASGELVMLGLNGNIIPVSDANLGTPFPNAVSFFSQGADGVNNPFVTELDETNTFVSPLERFNFNAIGHYDLTEDIRVFYEGLYARSEAVDRSNQPPWSTLFFNNADNGALGNHRINIADNPFVTGEMRDLFELNGIFDPTLTDDPATPDVDESDQYFWVTRSNIDLIGDSPNFLDQDVFRFVGGAEGDFTFITRDWQWEAAYTFGQTNASQRQNVINGRRLSFATDVVQDANGNPVCRVVAEGQVPIDNEGGLPGAGTDFDVADCVPINILDFGSITEEGRAFVVQQQGQSTKIEQLVAEFNVDGTLFALPAGEVGFATGVTHRRERASFDVTQGSQMGVAPNPPIAPVSGVFRTSEWYAESFVPLMQNGEGFSFLEGFIDTLSVEGAVRVVDNSEAGTDVTWTAGGRLTPAILDGILTIRGNYTEAIRSPAITELFLPRVQVGTFAIDPCDQRDIESGNNPEVRRENCEAAVAALAGSLEPDFNLDTFRAISRNASQSAITGGNPDLDNESSKAFSVGGIIAPDFIQGLEVTVDYSQIEISDAIVNLSADNILAACFDSPAFPNEPACDQFERDPVTFQPMNFITGFVNAASRRFRGLTLQSNYQANLVDFWNQLDGTMGLTFNWFHTFRSDQRVAAGDLNIINGTLGNEKNRFQANLTYTLNRFTGFLQWQGDLGGVISPNDLAAGNVESRDIQTFPSYDLFNVSFRYDLTDNFFVQAQVNNVLDADNKLLRQAATGSNTNFLDDPFGRRFLFTAGTRF